MDKLTKFKEIAQILDRDVPSKKEVARIIAKVIKAVKEAVKHLQQENKTHKQELERMVEKYLKSSLKELDKLESKLEKTLSKKADKDELLRTLERHRKEIVAMIPQVQDLKPLYDDMERVKGMIPEIPELDIDDLREKLDLEILDIKGLKEAIDKAAGTNKIRIPFGTRRIYQPHVERFKDDCDGANKTFYLEREPLRTSTVKVWGTDFPIILDPTVDFTVSGKTITLTDEVPAPSSGATLVIEYFA